MGDFPLFVNLEGAPCLVVGAGRVALRKVQALLPCGPRLTVVAPRALPEFSELERAGKLALRLRPFCPEDVEGCLLVVAAADDQALNGRVAALCRQRRILVNAAGSRAECTCKFPAVVRRGRLSVGISTGGASPTAARFFKERIEALLPPGEETDLEGILDWLAGVRDTVIRRVPAQRRPRIFAALFDRCMEAGRGLDAAELEDILKEAERDE